MMIVYKSEGQPGETFLMTTQETKAADPKSLEKWSSGNTFLILDHSDSILDTLLTVKVRVEDYPGCIYKSLAYMA